MVLSLCLIDKVFEAFRKAKKEVITRNIWMNGARKGVLWCRIWRKLGYRIGRRVKEGEDGLVGPGEKLCQ